MTSVALESIIAIDGQRRLRRLGAACVVLLVCTLALFVTGFFTAEFGNIASHYIIRALEFLGCTLNTGFLLDFRHIVSIQHIEAVGLLQMTDQNGLGLAAQTVRSV